MKTLCLIRHAYAEKMKYKTDYARLITKRGIEDAKSLGKNLKRETGLVYDKIISSPAMRAFETSLIVSKKLGIDENKIDIKESLYGNDDIQAILNIIKSIDDKYNNVILIGHNPAIEDIAKKLIKGFRQSINTCSALQIEFAFNSWSKVEENSGKFSFYKFNRFNPDLSEIDEALANAMKKEIYSRLEKSLKDVEANLISGDIEEDMEEGKKLAKSIFKRTDVITIRSLELLDAEVRKSEEAKRKITEEKIKKIEKKITKEYTNIKKNKSHKKYERLEQKKKKLEEMIGTNSQNN